MLTSFPYFPKVPFFSRTLLPLRCLRLRMYVVFPVPASPSPIPRLAALPRLDPGVHPPAVQLLEGANREDARVLLCVCVSARCLSVLEFLLSMHEDIAAGGVVVERCSLSDPFDWSGPIEH